MACADWDTLWARLDELNFVLSSVKTKWTVADGHAWEAMESEIIAVCGWTREEMMAEADRRFDETQDNEVL